MRTLTDILIKNGRVWDGEKFNYSDIGEYIDENHTDRPLRNDILVKLLNELSEENHDIKKENEHLKQQIKDLKVLKM